MIGITLALLLAAGSEAPVRVEADGIRVGSELVAGPALVLKGEAAPLLVSGSVVESLGAPVTVALDAARTLRLEAGVRLTRTAAGFTLATHGPSLQLDLAGRTLSADASLPFTLTEKGFDLGALGAFEAASLTAKPAAPTTVLEPQSRGQDAISPERRRRNQANLRRRFVFVSDPTASSAGVDFFVLRELRLLSPSGSN